VPASADTARQAGPRVLELEKIASQSKTWARRFRTSAILDLPDGHAEVWLEAWGNSAVASWALERGGQRQPGHVSVASVSAAMSTLAHRWNNGTLRLDSVSVRAVGSPVQGAALKQAALAAWCEACGVEVPSADALMQQQQAQQTQQQELREKMLAELRGGAKGVGKWNKRSKTDRDKAGPFRDADLAGANLSGADLQRLDFSAALFTAAKLARANLTEGKFRKAHFASADLTEAHCLGAQFLDADFTSATLRRALLRACSCRKTVFQNADLREANLAYANLCGADLSSARLDAADLQNAEYDETTRWAAGYVPPRNMKWCGKGPLPGSALPAPPLPANLPAIDFDTFLTRLRAVVDAGRLSNALQMLRSEKFQLFAEVKPEALVGIIRSQSSESRLYSCRLAADGSFACGTQNLRVCGGLGGAVCKHLLVLIVGLAKVGKIDLAAVEHWVRTSRQHRPYFDKDMMSETFLKYKGAEAGEVDWRPTETIPEDYYAL
jgi:uncharacterized protein YjbI with pentapeptide repeats